MLSGQRGNFFSMELLSENTGALLKWLPFNLLVSDNLKKEKSLFLNQNCREHRSTSEMTSLNLLVFRQFERGE